MKKIKLENVVSDAAQRHLIKRNCIDTADSFKRTKLKLTRTAEQYENLNLWGHKRIISVKSCKLTEDEAEEQFTRLQSWVESLDEIYRMEVEDIMFPALLSLYKKLESSSASGAESFYKRHQANYLNVPEYKKMADKFLSENSNHFTIELTDEAFELFSKFIANSDHPIFQHLLNTTLEVNIMKVKIDKPVSETSVVPKNVDLLNTSEELQDLMAAIAKMNALPPPTPLLKVLTIDTGQRKMCSASVSSCHRYISCGFQDSSLAFWDLNRVEPVPSTSEFHSLDLACAISVYHPRSPSPSSDLPLPSDSSSPIFRQGHSGPVYSTKFTPNNTHLISCSGDTTIRLWDLNSFENRVVYRGHTYPVWALDISKSEKYFISGSQDRTAKLWSFERTYPLRIFAGHTTDVDCVAIHANDKYVATGSSDSSVRMWNLDTGNSVRIFVGHRGSVLTIAFSPCGKYLASAGEDHRVIVWDLVTNKILDDFTGHPDVVYGLVWISDKLLASYSGDGVVRLWNVAQSPPTGSTPTTTTPESISQSIPTPWKPVHLSFCQRNSLVCIASSD